MRALILPLALGLTLGACRMLDASAPISFEPIVYTSLGDVEVPISTQRSSSSMSVMLIGDSLSVGPFGDRMLAYFRQKLVRGRRVLRLRGRNQTKNRQQPNRHAPHTGTHPAVNGCWT